MTGDRQALLAHSSSETTKIYTHPNFERALEFVNRLPNFAKRNQVNDTMVYRTSLFYIAKDPNLSSRNQGLSSVAGIGFEPMTSGL